MTTSTPENRETNHPHPIHQEPQTAAHDAEPDPQHANLARQALSQRSRRGYRRSASPYGLGSTATAAHHQPPGSGNITTNNNRREVGPLQASAVGPLQTAAPT
jgi:hypothetical protein